MRHLKDVIKYFVQKSNEAGRAEIDTPKAREEVDSGAKGECIYAFFKLTLTILLNNPPHLLSNVFNP